VTNTGQRASSSTSPNPSLRRIRSAAVGIAAGVVVLGLAVHFTLSGPVADFVADALYAVLMYTVVIFVLPRIRPIMAAGIAYALCVVIELAQVTDGPAALAAAFPPARLILGTTFAPVDLVAYAVGAAVALVVDMVMRKL
jgi:hypothetical protein